MSKEASIICLTAFCALVAPTSAHADQVCPLLSHGSAGLAEYQVRAEDSGKVPVRDEFKLLAISVIAGRPETKAILKPEARRGGSHYSLGRQLYGYWVNCLYVSGGRYFSAAKNIGSPKSCDVREVGGSIASVSCDYGPKAGQQ